MPCILKNAASFLHICIYILGGRKKTSRTLSNYDGTYTLWGEISFGTFVDQYVLLLNYKFQ